MKRFHQEVYFPENSTELLEGFIEEVKRNFPMTFSLHSVDHIIGLTDEYGNFLWKSLVKIIKNSPLSTEKIFEFYQNHETEKVTKACFRFANTDFPMDIVMVISSTSTIITLYLVNKNDTHRNLNKNLYIRKVKNNAKR